jgi:hypothetical protein
MQGIEDMLSQLRSAKDKLYTLRLQLDRDKLEYSKEWFLTSAETDQINSETDNYNQDVYSLNNASAIFNNQCARSP